MHNYNQQVIKLYIFLLSKLKWYLVNSQEKDHIKNSQEKDRTKNSQEKDHTKNNQNLCRLYLFIFDHIQRTLQIGNFLSLWENGTQLWYGSVFYIVNII